MTSFLYSRKPKTREGKELAQGHTARNRGAEAELEDDPVSAPGPRSLRSDAGLSGCRVLRQESPSSHLPGRFPSPPLLSRHLVTSLYWSLERAPCSCASAPGPGTPVHPVSAADQGRIQTQDWQAVRVSRKKGGKRGERPRSGHMQTGCPVSLHPGLWICPSCHMPPQPQGRAAVRAVFSHLLLPNLVSAGLST